MDDSEIATNEDATTIASSLFGYVAGSVDDFMPRLEAVAGFRMPEEARINLILEPLYYGLSFFDECARRRYPQSQRQAFTAEMDRTIRWFLTEIAFEARAVGFAPAPKTREDRPLTKQEEKVLSVFSHWLDVRREQYSRFIHSFSTSWAKFLIGLARVLKDFRPELPANVQADAMWLAGMLKQDMAENDFCCPEKLIQEFATEIVVYTRTLRAELL